MKTLLLLMLVSVSLFSGEVLKKKWESSENCYPCHKDIVKTWRTSRHAHSHFGKNDLFKKSLLYMTKKNPTMILDEMKMKCAQCHNPRIVKPTLDGDDKISLLMGHKSTKKAYKNMLGSKNMKDGINCLVCHNVDTIHLDKTKGSQGMNSIAFGPQGTMFGPFSDTAETPYHKSIHKEHFDLDKPDLCFACHFSGSNDHGLEVYATGREYEQTIKSKGYPTKGCKKCHMSRRKKGVASNYAKAGESPRERMVRAHRFASVDNSDILEKYLHVADYIDGGKLYLKLRNESPHKIPSGYGLREIILRVNFLRADQTEIDRQAKVLSARWGDNEGKTTIPHLATSILQDTRLPGWSSRAYAFPIPPKARYASYEILYRLISQKMAKELGVSNPFFNKDYKIFQKRIPLK